MKVTWVRKVYPLKFPFKLSYGTFTERVGYLIKMEEDSHVGWGEMSFVPYYGKNEKDIQAQLEIAREYFMDLNRDWEPPKLYDRLIRDLYLDPFVRSAIDSALYDLYGKKIGAPVWQIVGGSKDVPVMSSLTITEDDWEEKLEWDWPILKLKMGFDGDLELLTRIRKRYDGIIRIDANSGWKKENLNSNLSVMKELDIELVEQPVRKEDDSFLSEIVPDIPFAADESFQGLESLDDMNHRYQIINIKLQKCGGITPARRIIEQAKKTELKIMAGCMTESSIGIGAMSQLASFFDYLDVDGEYLINFDFHESLFLDHGSVRLEDKPGFGKNYRI